MDKTANPPQPHLVSLQPGSQVVINGALVTAIDGCTFEVGSGAFVLTGAALRRERAALRHPHEELYFSMLEAVRSPDMFADSQPRLFALLAQVAIHNRDHATQHECAACAAAMMSGDAQAAMASAARLASERSVRGEGERANDPAATRTTLGGGKAGAKRRELSRWHG